MTSACVFVTRVLRLMCVKRTIFAFMLFVLCPFAAHSAIVRDAVVPAYFYPSPNSAAWASLNVLAKKMPTTAIVRPGSDPGSAADQNYVKAIANLHASGGKVIAHVSTSYGNRRLSDVTKDINTTLALYRVDGFFIDEMTHDTSAAHVQYYQSLYNYIKSLSSTYTVTGNPATNVPERYLSLPLADKFVIFEDTLQRFKRQIVPAWQASYPAGRFISIVHSSQRSNMAAVMKMNSRRGIGGLFITTLTMPDPYFKLPLNWGLDMSIALSLQ